MNHIYYNAMISTGLILVAVGFSMVHVPSAFIAVGLLVICLTIFSAGINK